MPERDREKGKVTNFSPKNKGIEVNGDTWYTVEGGAWKFVDNLEKGDAVEYATNSQGNIVFISEPGSNQGSPNKTQTSSSSETNGVEEKLSEIEKYVAKNYDENGEMIKGLVESVAELQEEIKDVSKQIDTLGEALEIKKE